MGFTAGTDLSSQFIFMSNSWKCTRKFCLFFILFFAFLEWVFVFLFVFLGFGWIYCVLNLKTVIGFITACTLIALVLQYTAFCTQTKHSSCTIACYIHRTAKVCCFCDTLLSGRKSYRYFFIHCGQYQYRRNTS